MLYIKFKQCFVLFRTCWNSHCKGSYILCYDKMVCKFTTGLCFVFRTCWRGHRASTSTWSSSSSPSTARSRRSTPRPRNSSRNTRLGENALTLSPIQSTITVKVVKEYQARLNKYYIIAHLDQIQLNVSKKIKLGEKLLYFRPTEPKTIKLVK